MNQSMNCVKTIRGAVEIEGGKVEVVDVDALRQGQDRHARPRCRLRHSRPVKEFAQWVIWEAGRHLDARPASIHEFYIAACDDAWKDRTVPAMNIRFTTYDTARAAYRAALKTNTGAFIFEIARSEMGYTRSAAG